MGLRGEERVRMALEAFEGSAVEVVRREGKAVGVAAYLVEGRESEPAVEGGVLDALRHHGARRLLPARDELRLFEAEDDAAQILGKDGARPPVLLADLVGLDVRAIDAERGSRLL